MYFFIKKVIFINLIFITFAFTFSPFSLTVKSEEARKSFNLGIRLYYNKSYEIAIRSFLEALQKDSGNPLIHYYLGMAFLKSGYSEQAIQEWKNIVAISGKHLDIIQKINNLLFLDSIDKKKTYSFYNQYIYFNSYPLANNHKEKEHLFYQLFLPIKIMIDNKDNVFVLDYKVGNFLQTTNNGVLSKIIIGGIQQNIPYVAPLDKPFDFIFNQQGEFFISDFKSDQIIKFSSTGNQLLTIGKTGINKGNLLGPKGLALSHNNNLFVADSGNSKISLFNSKGQELYSFGKRGSNEGEFILPSSLYFHSQTKTLYVVDQGNKRIQYFDTYGKYLGEFGNNFLKNPQQISFANKDNNVLILDQENLFSYNLNTKKYSSLLNDFSPNKKNFFSSFDFDKQGFLYLSNMKTSKIDIYSPKQFLYTNWNVQLESLYLKDFPLVGLTVTVKDKLGIPITNLKDSNFLIQENGIKVIHKIDKSNHLKANRTIVLIEKSKEAEGKKKSIEVFLSNLFQMSNKQKDTFKIMTYGGSNGNYQEITPFTTLPNISINRTLKGTYFSKFSVSKVLKKAINLHLSHSFKPTIILFVFSPYNSKEHFLTEKYENIITFAKSNFIPIYVVFSGINRKANFNHNQWFYLKKLAEKTSGELLFYNEKIVKSILTKRKELNYGLYQINYKTLANPDRRDFLRNISIDVEYRGTKGRDAKIVYPIP